jgi:hypothetical protein
LWYECRLQVVSLSVPGAEAASYTYTVTFYAGDQGKISSSGISVDGGGDYAVTCDGTTVRITGLTASNHVRFQNSAVMPEADSRYYVKGVRMGGRDNNTVDLSYFPVERDQDYVVAYGIRGELTRYTVNYVDSDGNALYPSQTYYGNTGDKPVVAYLYVEGYQPQAYNLTKTLQNDAGQNVFTFVCRAVAAGQTEEGTGGNAAAGAGEAADGNTGGAGENAENTGGLAPGDAGENAGADGQAPGDGQDAAGDENGDGGGQEEPPGLVDIDDQEVPLANPNVGGDGTIAAANRGKRQNMLIAGMIGALSLAGIGAGFFIYLRLRKGKHVS